MQKALFLDRDGVINVDNGYVCTPENTHWVAGIFELLRHFQNLNYRLVVVTNQSGIGRGFYSESQFHHYTEWMKGEFQKHSISFDGVYYCPHHPNDAEDPYRVHCQCRKPESGLFYQAINDLKLDPTQSLMIGDSWRDVIAAERASVKDIFYLASALDDNQKQYASASSSNIYLIESFDDIYKVNIHDFN